jgi:tetratricopeptide (TPR) repeat protein
LLALQRAVCDDQAPSPSTLVAQALDADLDAIVMMALRKEPQRRYASAGQLGDDLGHYLAGQPVTARPDSVGYRLRKFVGRNRVAVAAAAVVTIALLSATVFATGQASARARALAVAEAERARSEQLNDFLIDIFRESEPGAGGEVTARQLLDAGARRIDFALDARPQVQASMAQAIGEAYGALGLYDQADSLIARALETRREALPADHPDLASVLQSRGSLRVSQGRYDEAAAAYDAALTVLEAADAPDPLARSLLLEARASLDLLRGDHDHARRCLAEAQELLEADAAGDQRSLARIWRLYGRLAADQRDWDQALAAHRRALALWPDSLVHRHPRYYDLLESVALTLTNLGEVDSALALHRETLDGRRRMLGPTHPTVGYSLHNLGRELAQLGDHAGAIPYYQEAIAIREASLGADHPAVGHAVESLAIATAMTGDAAGSERLFLRSLAIHRHSLGPRHAETIESMTNLAYLCNSMGRADEALGWLEQAAAAGWRDAGLLEGTYAHLGGDPRYQALLHQVRADTVVTVMPAGD